MKISVIIAAYNAAQYLHQAIDSALQQTYPPHEIIVADDYSTDRTAEIASSYGGRVRVIRLSENKGPGAARNAAAELSTGDWLAFLDADDWFLPDKLLKQQARAQQDSNAVLIYTGIKTWSSGRYNSAYVAPPEKLWPALRYSCPMQISSVLVRADAFKAVDGFDSSRIYIGIEDWELWLRILERFSPRRFSCVDEPLAVYRCADGSLSTNALRMHEASGALLERHLLRGTRGLNRVLWRRRILAFRQYDTAILLREQRNPIYFKFMANSLMNWPLPSRPLSWLRYKVFASMLQKRLGTLVAGYSTTRRKQNSPT